MWDPVVILERSQFRTDHNVAAIILLIERTPFLVCARMFPDCHQYIFYECLVIPTDSVILKDTQTSTTNGTTSSYQQMTFLCGYPLLHFFELFTTALEKIVFNIFLILRFLMCKTHFIRKRAPGDTLLSTQPV